MNFIFHFSDLYLEWLLAIAFVGGIAAPLNYRWVSKFDVHMIPLLVFLPQKEQNDLKHNL